ncbi:hypothetical protein [Parabacteroides sp. Marseille-P3160]|uniref:hypothetical protein n=1 Tax=Parabacteroides sp. Marseille-P3160 TaxID=1917887 RepID=UPI0009BAFBFB|nr:hypothetical protein [Parabacteroides sp. Marseille-P3160]
MKKYFPGRTDPNGFAEFDYIPFFFGNNQETFFAIDIPECFYLTPVGFGIEDIPCYLDGPGDFPVFNPCEYGSDRLFFKKNIRCIFDNQ